MSGRFITKDDIARDTFDWGQTGWMSRPSLTGSTTLCVMDVTITPGNGHNFHRHPDQEELIWVREGRIEQWLERDKRVLEPGEAIHIPKDTVHASFNIGDGDARIAVILSPTAGEDGYSVVDVFEEEPWASAR